MARVSWFACALFLGVVSHAEAQNGAQFVSFGPPPGQMNPGQVYAVSMTMANTGASPWIPGTHRLGSVNPQDNLHWGMTRVDLATTVYPGQAYTFSFSITAPASAAVYAWDWRMVHEGVEWFGEYSPTIWVTVGNPAPPVWNSSGESSASMGTPGGPPSLGAPTSLTWLVRCRFFGQAPSGSSGYSYLTMRLLVNYAELKSTTVVVAPNNTYDHTLTVEVSASESQRTLDCRSTLDPPVGPNINYVGTQRIIPGNGPRFSEVLIKTFIPDEWVVGPAEWSYSFAPVAPVVLEGDNRGFDYNSSQYRTRVLGHINNPAFDSNVLRWNDQHRAGLSVAFDPFTSLSPVSLSGHLTASARADETWGYPEKLTWGYSNLQGIVCTEFSSIGLVGNRAGIRFRCNHAASMPLFNLSPNIDWQYKVDMWFGDDNVFVTINESCIDYFPSHEMYIHGVGVVISPASLGPLGGLTPVCAKPVNISNQRLFQ